MKRNIAATASVLALVVGLFGAGTTDARTLAKAPLGEGLTLPYFVSDPRGGAGVTRILVALHGYTRDATRTYDAAVRAAAEAGHGRDTLIVVPIFQVPPDEATRCHFRGTPRVVPGNALWHCHSWAEGEPALNGRTTSFAAMDALVSTLLDTYPMASRVTIAGFSAGAQFVQRYAAFSATPPRPVALRYVIADPSSFLYFDPARPLPGAAACPGYDRWKFGTEDLPGWLGRGPGEARAAYASADLHYLEGALDTGTGPGTAFRLLETGCAAELQGRFRLDRGAYYAAYDDGALAHGAHILTIVPACAHSVSCVFPSQAARSALFGLQ